MSDKTGIEWTDATWNPVRGCSRVSEGCRHCYAEGVARRFSGPGMPYEHLVRITSDGGAKAQWNGNTLFVPKHLLDPIRWTNPRRIFVNSMSDLFHEGIPEYVLDLIFAVMMLSSRHTFQVLTKRPKRMLEYLSAAETRDRILAAAAGIIEGSDWHNRPLTDTPFRYGAPAGIKGKAGKAYVREELVRWPLANVWLGVSAENQVAANERVPSLLMTPAAGRFVSLEPLLGPVDLSEIEICDGEPDEEGMVDGFFINALAGSAYDSDGDLTTGEDGEVPIGGKINLAIVGGESGSTPGIRMMHPDWARNVRDMCAEHDTIFFFKQWGEWIPWEQEVPPMWRSQHGRSEDGHALFPDDIADDPKGWDSGLGFEDEDHCVFQRVGKKAAGSLLDGVQHHYFPGVVA